MRWLNARLLVGLAPLLSLVDAVDGAPAGALANGAHRRAPVDSTPDSPWHRRHAASKRQADDTNDLPIPIEGPPSVITVPDITPPDPTPPTDPNAPTDPTDPAPTDTTTTSTTETSTSTTSSDTSTSTTVDPTSTSTTEDPLISLSISLPIPIPLPTDPTTTSTTDAPAPTDPPVVSESSTSVVPTDDPIISISISLPPIFEPSTSDPPQPSISTPEPSISTPVDPPPSNSVSSEPPVITPDPSISTPPTDPPTSSSSSVILSLPDLFPSISVPGGSVTTTDVESTSRPPITIESQFQFITATSFLIAPTSSSASASVTNTDPDAVLSSNDLQSPGASATVTAAIIPSSVPMFIAPPPSSDHVAPHTTIDGYTEISILFQPTAGWMWILQSSETAAQILAYLPPIIIQSLSELGSVQGDVKTIGLSAFQPADATSANDLRTMWVGLLKTEYVSPLSAMIKTPGSEFYNTGDPVAQSIAKNVVAAYNIATLNGVSNEDGSSTTNNSGQTVVDNSRRNAIIGVSTAFGLIALIVFIWWIVKTYKARRDGMHKRLSYDGATNYGAAGAGISAGAGYGGGYGGGYGAGGVRAESPPALHNPFMTEREREEEARGIRRNSFYAIGPDDASIEEETFDYMSQRSSTGAIGLNRAGSGGSGGARWVSGSGGLTVPGAPSGAVRRPVVGQQISQPILRESSMGNW